MREKGAPGPRGAPPARRRHPAGGRRAHEPAGYKSAQGRWSNPLPHSFVPCCRSGAAGDLTQFGPGGGKRRVAAGRGPGGPGRSRPAQAPPQHTRSTQNEKRKRKQHSGGRERREAAAVDGLTVGRAGRRGPSRQTLGRTHLVWQKERDGAQRASGGCDTQNPRGERENRGAGSSSCIPPTISHDTQGDKRQRKTEGLHPWGSVSTARWRSGGGAPPDKTVRSNGGRAGTSGAERAGLRRGRA
jgi:hypothetical protein